MTEDEARIEAERIVAEHETNGVVFDDREAAIARYMRFLMDESAG